MREPLQGAAGHVDREEAALGALHTLRAASCRGAGALRTFLDHLEAEGGDQVSQYFRRGNCFVGDDVLSLVAAALCSALPELCFEVLVCCERADCQASV